MSNEEIMKPGPQSYKIRSQFELNKNSTWNLKNGKGYSFTETHQAYEKVYNEASPVKRGLGPDAGLYNINSFVDILKKDNKKFTLGARYIKNKVKTAKTSPGPATYNVKFDYSKYQN